MHTYEPRLPEVLERDNEQALLCDMQQKRRGSIQSEPDVKILLFYNFFLFNAQNARDNTLEISFP